MKNLKKFAALLLVGAMALLMLTACGGGGGSVNNPEEQKVLNHISNQKGVHVTSDAQLRRVAEEHLREDLEGALQLGNHKLLHQGPCRRRAGRVSDRHGYHELHLQRYPFEQLAGCDLEARQYGYQCQREPEAALWSKVGVVIQSQRDQQSYIGLSIRVKNPHK